MRVKVSINEKAAIREGVEPARGYVYVDVPLATLTQRQREALARTGQTGAEQGGNTIYLATGTATVEAVAVALEVLATERETEVAQHQVKVEEYVQKFLGMDRETFKDTYISSYKEEAESLEDPRLKDKIAARVAYQKEQKLQKELAERETLRLSVEAEAAREAKLNAERESREAEKSAWIEGHGSRHLVECVARGYDCRRRYVEERVLAELGEGWYVDWKDRATLKDRSCPTEAGLSLQIDLEGEGIEVTVMWQTDDGSEHDSGDEFTPHEVVVVENYLGQYRLIHSTT